MLLLLNQTEEMEQPDKITARQDMKIQYCLYVAALSEDDVTAIWVDAAPHEKLLNTNLQPHDLEIPQIIKVKVGITPEPSGKSAYSL